MHFAQLIHSSRESKALLSEALGGVSVLSKDSEQYTPCYSQCNAANTLAIN